MFSTQSVKACTSAGPKFSSLDIFEILFVVDLAPFKLTVSAELANSIGLVWMEFE